MKKTLNYGFTLLLILASIGGLVATRGWNSTTALFPRAIALPMLLLALAILLRDILADRRRSREAAGLDAGAAAEDTARLAAVAVRFAWLIAFTLVIWALGLVPAIFLFVVAYMGWQGRCCWGRSVLFAAVTAAAVYLIFNLAFQVVWPDPAVAAWWTG